MTQVLFFAQLREQLNSSGLTLELQSPCSVAELQQKLQDDNPQWQPIFANSQVLASVNQTLVDTDAMVQPGDEVAVFPPVTGG